MVRKLEPLENILVIPWNEYRTFKKAGQIDRANESVAECEPDSKVVQVVGFDNSEHHVHNTENDCRRRLLQYDQKAANYRSVPISAAA